MGSISWETIAMAVVSAWYPTTIKKLAATMLW